ncbi:MAG: hypothetical protein LBJ10_10990 [Clostridiales bacterium]|jgi:phenylalanyl-tRNA synthetase beta chain|nr:hypothetical protein [Clostridiales bacterium]
MRVPVKWLGEYVDIGIGAQELAQKMTLSGTKADSVEYLGEGIERVVAGRILALERHPNADKLQVARVDAGSANGGEIQIITGATNIKEGDVVPIALDKSRLPGGVRIKATKMRGLDSCGMMCSIQELALSKYDWPGAAEDGIFILEPGTAPGADIREVLGLDDTAIDFDITYNRADCLGILGIAREAAAVLGRPYTPPRAFAEGLRGAAGGAMANGGQATGGSAAANGGSAVGGSVAAGGNNAGGAAANGDSCAAANGVDGVDGVDGGRAGKGAGGGIGAAASGGSAAGRLGDMLSVEIREPDLCPRYTARIVTGARIGDSPEWMKRRLRNAGVRPINNIVDITNYVMLETGQPMHAFDMRFVGGGAIVVRRAGEGESIRTLDGGERALDPSMLVIADRDRPIAVAGVMGGANSEILPDTGTIVFESANFDGVSIRRTARRLGMRTESSSRYEKGLDAEMALPAADRAADLVERLGAGTVVGGHIDAYPRRAELARVKFSPERINALLGTGIDAAFMLGVLEKLGFSYDESSGEAIVPSFRRDVGIEADLAEEVARFYDYNNIKATLGAGAKATIGMRTREQKLRQTVLDTAASCGYSEIYTLSFQSPKAFDRLGLPPGSPLRDAVRVGNPSSEDASLMRTTTVPDMLRVLADNGNRRIPSAELFEISHTYHPAPARAVGEAAAHGQPAEQGQGSGAGQGQAVAHGQPAGQAAGSGAAGQGQWAADRPGAEQGQAAAQGQPAGQAAGSGAAGQGQWAADTLGVEQGKAARQGQPAGQAVASGQAQGLGAGQGSAAGSGAEGLPAQPPSGAAEAAAAAAAAVASVPLPEQRAVLTLGAYGGQNDFYSMKGAFEDIFAAAGARRHRFRACEDVPFLHPGRAAYIDIAGAEAGFFGEVHPLARAAFELPERAYVGVVSLDRLFAAASLGKSYRKLPKYPPVPRDLALVADSGVKYADIVAIMRKAAGEELESVELFDVYTGRQVPEGKKSLAFSLLFRAGDRTLVDDEVSAHIKAIVGALSREAGVELRQ